MQQPILWKDVADVLASAYLNRPDVQRKHVASRHWSMKQQSIEPHRTLPHDICAHVSVVPDCLDNYPRVVRVIEVWTHECTVKYEALVVLKVRSCYGIVDAQESRNVLTRRHHHGLVDS